MSGACRQGSHPGRSAIKTQRKYAVKRLRGARRSPPTRESESTYFIAGAIVGADYAFVQSVVDVYLSKDGDSDIKFADDKRQQKFLELVVPKIQLLSIAK